MLRKESPCLRRTNAAPLSTLPSARAFAMRGPRVADPRRDAATPSLAPTQAHRQERISRRGAGAGRNSSVAFEGSIQRVRARHQCPRRSGRARFCGMPARLSGSSLRPRERLRRACAVVIAASASPTPRLPANRSAAIHDDDMVDPSSRGPRLRGLKSTYGAYVRSRGKTSVPGAQRNCIPLSHLAAAAAAGAR